MFGALRGLWHAHVGWLFNTVGQADHAFPTSAFHGLRRRELDPGGVFIQALERMGLAWRVVRVAPERQQREAAA